MEVKYKLYEYSTPLKTKDIYKLPPYVDYSDIDFSYLNKKRFNIKSLLFWLIK